MVRLRVPDWLPALVNAARSFVVITVAAMFWIVTAWPSGAVAMLFTSITVILLAPRGDLAYTMSVGFSLGTLGATLGAFNGAGRQSGPRGMRTGHAH